MIENLRTSKGIAAIAVFAAFHTVLSALPYTIAIGVSGSITLGVISAPLVGILLGPLSGGIAVMIGSIIGMFINPAGAIFGALSFLPATIGAFSAGFMITKRGYISAAMIVAALFLFFCHPFGQEAMVYPFMHIIAVGVASPKAHGQAITRTATSRIMEGINSPVSPHQLKKVRNAMAITDGTNTAATRSAKA